MNTIIKGKKEQGKARLTVEVDLLYDITMSRYSITWFVK
jgi:hypothetical protein